MRLLSEFNQRYQQGQTLIKDMKYYVNNSLYCPGNIGKYRELFICLRQYLEKNTFNVSFYNQFMTEIGQKESVYYPVKRHLHGECFRINNPPVRDFFRDYFWRCDFIYYADGVYFNTKFLIQTYEEYAEIHYNINNEEKKVKRIKYLNSLEETVKHIIKECKNISKQLEDTYKKNINDSKSRYGLT